MSDDEKEFEAWKTPNCSFLLSVKITNLRQAWSAARKGMIPRSALAPLFEAWKAFDKEQCNFNYMDLLVEIEKLEKLRAGDKHGKMEKTDGGRKEEI
jgi:hypothetical protein